MPSRVPAQSSAGTTHRAARFPPSSCGVWRSSGFLSSAGRAQGRSSRPGALEASAGGEAARRGRCSVELKSRCAVGAGRRAREGAGSARWGEFLEIRERAIVTNPFLQSSH